MAYKYRRIAVKIGSNVLTRFDGTLDLTRMSALVDQVAYLHKKGVQIVMISSGAVAAGKSELKVDKKLDPVSSRQLYSAIGQAKLMNRYFMLFQEHGIACGQVLTSKESFGSRTHYLTQKHCIDVMLANKVIPIVNENDAISVTELMFTDNDELSGMIAAMMDMEALIILSNIDGIFDGNPAEETSRVIREIPLEVTDLSQFVQPGKSTFGRGGMLTKCNIAQKIAREGISVIIANGKKNDILIDLLDRKKEVVCTEFVSTEKPISSVKKWIAHAEDFAKGKVVVNKGAVQVLLDETASSLLLVGVTHIEGDFEQDDIIAIYNEEKELIALGCSAYSSSEAKKVIGKHNLKPLVHYDYLYLI